MLILLGCVFVTVSPFSVLCGSSKEDGFDADAMLEQLQAVRQMAILSPEGAMESTGTKGPALKMASSPFTPSPELVSSSGKVSHSPSSPRGYE